MASTVNTSLGTRRGHFVFVLVLVAQVLLLSSQVTNKRGESALRSFFVVLSRRFSGAPRLPLAVLARHGTDTSISGAYAGRTNG